MADKEVAVLLSTYNGANYLAEQIESLQKQLYKNWNLFIRDDGSTDQTQQIIKEFCAMDFRIHWINADKQKNCGVKQSFLTLLEKVDADFYMFCDQDDVWLPNKIEVTVAAMNNDKEIPQLVFTDLNLVDEKLQLISNETVLSRVNTDYWLNPDNLFFDNIVTGCTVMINNSLKKKVLPVDSQQIVMHDWFFALIAAQSGQIHFINQPTILYRQHQDNQVGINKSFFGKLRKIKDFSKFEKLLILQIKQGKISIAKTNYVPMRRAENFLKIFDQGSSVRKSWMIFKNGFKKHTISGTLALNAALLGIKFVKD
ncbi:glycosyltransferase family 2 protein [Levilactobacillus acidifarinae]|uniref:Cps1H protein n=1 Tax=Levilactobacillus acidifarinae DSM 19394 = JCM 15949 TaxID=1423715 RepID=A0A0R1LGW2_9LACO|nr:glycosyltransferase family 2 protein [Levilactobacillus acidifarinae]KRK95131.1 cps1H protein [Levilactobacillus acidifarinae DSM 19394]GEO70630.1 glycosyltransferase (rhamnosyltransferase),family 2 (GT2) [Levilactobacillus acidifarinae]